METPFQFARFGTTCRGCCATLIVEPTDRDSGVTCKECGIVNGPWPNVTSDESLPDNGADLRVMIRFSDSYNPLPHFQSLWGNEYRTRVSELWDRCVRAYKGLEAPPSDVRELLMCLQYDIVLGPALGVPEPHKLSFLHWLIDKIRGSLRAAGL